MYRGRFAPSPTGPLHFGSIVAATASFLDAKAHNGEWLVRMEDLDKRREQTGAAASILRTLERFGFEWDGDVLFQSARTGAYEDARRRADAFACACSRQEVTACRCRHGLPQGRMPRTWRVRSSGELVCFEDRVHRRFCDTPDDFVLLRADGYHAYQLAVVVDDAYQGVTDIVRGSDLLDSTPRQILLQRMLGLSTPRYLHVPVAVSRSGQKLSKQALAPAVSPSRDVLREALVFLGQPPCETLREARQYWSTDRIPREVSVAVNL